MGGGVHFPCKSFPNKFIGDGGRLNSRNVLPGFKLDALLPVPSGFKWNSNPTETLYSYSNPTENAISLEFSHGSPSFLTDARTWGSGLQQRVSWTRPSNSVEILPTLKRSYGMTSREDCDGFNNGRAYFYNALRLAFSITQHYDYARAVPD